MISFGPWSGWLMTVPFSLFFCFSFNFTSKNYKGTFLFRQQFTLGISSLSKLGPVGAAIEVAVILYLAVTSAIGLYTLPGVRIVQPRFRSTPLTHLIANCALLLVLSSALPLLSRILGKARITWVFLFRFRTRMFQFLLHYIWNNGKLSDSRKICLLLFFLIQTIDIQSESYL